MLCQYCGTPLADDVLSRTYAFGVEYDEDDEPHESSRIVTSGDCGRCGTKNRVDLDLNYDHMLDYEYDNYNLTEETATG